MELLGTTSRYVKEFVSFHETVARRPVIPQYPRTKTPISVYLTQHHARHSPAELALSPLLN